MFFTYTDISADCLLAQEIERQEHEARKLREQREFEILKVGCFSILFSDCEDNVQAT